MLGIRRCRRSTSVAHTGASRSTLSRSSDAHGVAGVRSAAGEVMMQERREMGTATNSSPVLSACSAGTLMMALNITQTLRVAFVSGAPRHV